MLILMGRLMIKEMYRKGVSIRAITRRTGRESKSITNSLVAVPKSRKKQVRKIDPYVHYLVSPCYERKRGLNGLGKRLLQSGYQGKFSSRNASDADTISRRSSVI